MNSKKYYFYKLMVDSGGAPCVYRNILSLAICKPAIRSTCEIGNWVLGFGSKTRLGERLIYIAEITEKYKKGEYYRIRRYQSRPDNIYQWTRSGHLTWKQGAQFHEGGYQPDIGVHPQYKSANVLISNNFKYFGAAGTDAYKETFPTLGKAIESLKQGHRVKHSEELANDIVNLINWAWKKYSARKIGSPTDADRSANCSKCEGSVIVCNSS